LGCGLVGGVVGWGLVVGGVLGGGFWWGWGAITMIAEKSEKKGSEGVGLRPQRHSEQKHKRKTGMWTERGG